MAPLMELQKLWKGVHAWDVSRSLEDVSHRFSLWAILTWFIH